ncbi:O-methyltransferase [Rhodopirellula maiorica SM1]|uniref:O-methyltransferase n=2 Tax=Novipirellula TaxID=2795426 RepID=M5R9A0_9BACT|nr:O-methyltransferase [Rhodopirellula maiorica SM1]
MWLEFFSQATINGLDISDFSDVEIPRATIFQADQSDARRLTEIAEEVGPFDIIIDDGSHASAHQQVTLGALFPYLKPGGLYVIEDTHWQPERSVERREGIETMLTIFKRFSIYGESIKSPYLSDERCREIEQNVVRCTFSHPFVDENARPQKRSMIRDISRRVLKGKSRQSDQRLFKLIILEKKAMEDRSGFETTAVQMTCDAV